MKDQVLSINQMHKLKELGIDDNKAKIYWIKQVNGTSINEPINGEPFLSLHKGEKFMHAGFMRFETIPTFTLQDIIELMPNSIEFDNQIYYLEIHKNGIEYTEYEKYESLYICNEDLILLNAYNMLVWLAKHNYI